MASNQRSYDDHVGYCRVYFSVAHGQKMGRMDEARITMRERVVFHELEGQEQYDHDATTDEEDVYFYFRMWQIELRPWSWEEKKVQHADGQDVDISTASVNELYVHRVNAINFLWAW